MQAETRSLINDILSSIIFQVVQTHDQEQNQQSYLLHIDSSERLLIGDYTCLFKEVQIQVLECYKQVNSDICGFHCVFNLINFLEYGLSKPKQEVKTNLNNGSSFWKLYKEIYNFLVSAYPNKSEVKSLDGLGPLERIHMEYIIENWNKTNSIKKRIGEEGGIGLFIQPFYYGFGIIQNSDEELKRIQDLAISLISEKDDILLIFPLGVTIHWSLLIIYVRKNMKEYFYLDSKNARLDHILKGDINEAIHDLEETEKYGGRETRNTLEEKRQISWMNDLRKSIEIIIDVINRKKTITQFVVEGSIDETINDFYNYLEGEDLAKLSPKSVRKIYQWFEDEYRPQVISNNLLRPLSISPEINRDHYSKLDEFEKVCRQFISVAGDSVGNEAYDFEEKLLKDIFNFNEELSMTLKKIKV